MKIRLNRIALILGAMWMAGASAAQAELLHIRATVKGMD